MHVISHETGCPHKVKAHSFVDLSFMPILTVLIKCKTWCIIVFFNFQLDWMTSSPICLIYWEFTVYIYFPI